MPTPKRVDAGTEGTEEEGRSWEFYAAKELKEGGTKTIAEMVGVIRKYSTPMIKFMANVPVEISLRTKIPGTPNFQLLCANVIQVGQQRALAKKDLPNPMFLESFLLEGRRAWPIGYKEGFDDHETGGAIIL